MKSLRILCIIILVSVYSFVIAEETRADSILKALPETSGIERVDLLNELVPILFQTSAGEPDSLAGEAISLSRELGYTRGEVAALHNAGKMENYRKNYPAGYSLLRDAEKLSQKLNDKTIFLNIKHDIAMNYYSQGNFEEAQKILQKFLPQVMSTDNIVMQAKFHNSIGLCNWRTGDFNTALEHYNKSLEISPSRNHNTLNNISIIYGMSGNLEQSLKFQEEALAIRQEMGNMDGMLDSYNNLGLIYREMKKPFKALEFMKKSVNTAKKLNRPAAANKALNNIGSVYDSVLNMPDSALYYYKKSIDISSKTLENYDFLNTKLNIGFLEAKLGNYSEGRIIIKEVLTKAKKINAAEIVEHCYIALSNLEENDGNFKESLYYYKNYTAVKDSIYNLNTQNKIADLQVRYESEKNQLENQKFKLLLIEKDVKNQRLYFGSLLLLITLIIFIIFYFSKIQHNKKLAAEIEVRKKIENNLESLVLERTNKLTISNENLKEEIKQHKIAQSKLKKIQESLESEVDRRTKELKEANESLNNNNKILAEYNDELANLNKQFIGREFRIKELKNQIIELKKQSGDYS